MFVEVESPSFKLLYHLFFPSFFFLFFFVCDCWYPQNTTLCKGSPDILPYEADLIEDLMEQVENQEVNINGSLNGDTNHAFVASLYQVRWFVVNGRANRIGKGDRNH